MRIIAYKLQQRAVFIQIHIRSYQRTLIKSEQIAAARKHDIQEFFCFIQQFRRITVAHMLEREHALQNKFLSEFFFKQFGIALVDHQDRSCREFLCHDIQVSGPVVLQEDHRTDSVSDILLQDLLVAWQIKLYEILLSHEGRHMKRIEDICLIIYHRRPSYFIHDRGQDIHCLQDLISASAHVDTDLGEASQLVGQEVKRRFRKAAAAHTAAEMVSHLCV